MRLAHRSGAVPGKKIGLLRDCAGHWKMYSSFIKQYYKPQRFARLCSYVDPEYFDRWAELDIQLAENQ